MTRLVYRLRPLFCATLLALSASQGALAQSLQLRLQGLRFVNEQAADPATALLEVPALQLLSLAPDGRYRVETDTLYPGQIRFRFVETGGPEGSTVVDVLRWRNGTEWQTNSAANARNNRAEQLFLVPAWLLAQASERKPLAGEPGHAESFVDAAGRPGRLWFERAGGRLLRAQSPTLSYEYSAETLDADGLKQPRKINVSAGATLRARWQVESLSREPLADSLYQVAAGYVAPVERGPLRATALGGGSYRVDGTASGYHLGFVVGSEGVAVFDTPVNADEGRQVRALIARTAPGLPVRHVVLSHGHRDHTGGLAAYLDEGAQIHVGAGGRAALTRQHGAAVAARATELSKARELDLGGRRLQVLPLPSSHARDMLVAHEVESGVLFQGDLFYIPEVGPVPPAFEVSEELAALIEQKRLKPTVLVGIHGRSGSPAELAQSLALRRAAEQGRQPN